MRLIDADSIHYTRLLSQQGLDMELVPKAVIDNTPTIDAVEVVRCRECKRRGIVYECPMCYTEDWYDEDEGYDSWDVDKTIDDGFCHCGEKIAAEVTDEQ